MQRPRNVAPIEHALLAGDDRQNLFRLFPDQFGVAPRRLAVQPASATPPDRAAASAWRERPYARSARSPARAPYASDDRSESPARRAPNARWRSAPTIGGFQRAEPASAADYSPQAICSPARSPSCRQAPRNSPPASSSSDARENCGRLPGLDPGMSHAGHGWRNPPPSRADPPAPARTLVLAPGAARRSIHAAARSRIPARPAHPYDFHFASAAFHKAERSKAHSASAPCAMTISQCSTPCRRVKSCVRPSRSLVRLSADAIGGRRHGASPRRAADGFHAEVVDRQSKPPNRFTDSLAVYPRLSCEATRKCALKHPSLRSVTFQGVRVVATVLIAWPGQRVTPAKSKLRRREFRHLRKTLGRNEQRSYG